MFQKLFWLASGLVLLSYFGAHVLFYGGLYCVAQASLAQSSKHAGQSMWNAYSKRWINSLFQVRLHNYREYNSLGKTPVIFVLNRLPDSWPFDECVLSTLNQRNVRIVAEKQTETTVKAKLLQMLDYLPVETKGGGGFDSFMKSGAAALDEGSSLLMMPESDKKGMDWFRMARLHRGPFALAKQNNVPIVPVIVEGYRCPAGYVKAGGSLDLHFLDPVRPQEYTTSEGLRDQVRTKMNTVLQQLQDSTRDVSLLQSIIQPQSKNHGMTEKYGSGGSNSSAGSAVSAETKVPLKKNGSIRLNEQKADADGAVASGGAAAGAEMDDSVKNKNTTPSRPAADKKGWFDDLVSTF